MAGEIQFSGGLSFIYSGQTTSITMGNTSVTPSEVEVVSGIRSVGTSDETLAVEDISAPGWLFVKNLDATNYVELGPDGTAWTVKIPASSSAGPMLWNAAAVHLKANTGACLVQYVVTGR